MEYISFKNILPHLRQVNVLEKEKVLLPFFWLWHSQICETASGAKPTFFFLKTIQPRKSGFDELPRFYDFPELLEILKNFILWSTKIFKRLRKTSLWNILIKFWVTFLQHDDILTQLSCFHVHFRRTIFVSFF